MSTGYKPIALLPEIDEQRTRNEDLEYWLRMREVAIFQERGTVNSVSFSPKNAFHLATANMNRVTIFDTTISQPIWTRSQFRSNVYGLKFRKDGRMLGLGSADGYIHFLDVTDGMPSKKSLRVFKAHDAEVHALEYRKLNCATYADDGQIKLWDLSTNSVSPSPIWQCEKAHNDRIRASAVSDTNDNWILSGSYDHTIKLWDLRNDSNTGATMTIEHGFPLESLLLHSNNRIVISAGGNVVKFWDISAGGRLIHTFQQHNRTVTSLKFTSDLKYLLTGGMDRRIHVVRIDRGEFNLVNTLATAAPIIAVDISNNDESMGFGMNNLLCIYRRHPKSDKFSNVKYPNSAYIGDGIRRLNNRENIVQQRQHGCDSLKFQVRGKQINHFRLGKLDLLLRSGHHRKFLDRIFLDRDLFLNKPDIVVASFQQLQIRGELAAPLSGRQGSTLYAILFFLANNLLKPGFFDVLVDVAQIILRIYADEHLSKRELMQLKTLNKHIQMLFPPSVLDDDEAIEIETSDDEDVEALKARKRKRNILPSGGFSMDFEFEGEEEPVANHLEGISKYLKKSAISTLQDKINKERSNIEAIGAVLANQVKASSEDLIQELTEKSDFLREKKLKNGKSENIEFFDPSSEEIAKEDKEVGFSEMDLSRPILKAATEAGLYRPTPIQAKCIPLALSGKDICACSATGTGKTAAFMLPILERLLYCPREQRSTTRVLVLAPTRELAIQIFQVARRLSKYSSVEICLCAGGLDLKTQEAALRLGLDIVIATPGRLIDHLHNSPNFTLLDVEILVLDEADKMLEEQFADQMKEIIRLCAKNRQTMLFSATMTDEVEDLAQMSLKSPMRLFVNENTDTAENLRQEFVRIREDRELSREAIVCALVTRNFPDHTIVFVRTKRHCERVNIVLGLFGVRVGQLHGGLSQSQRIAALNAFKLQQIDVLVCTDLAARGLDVEGVQTVINLHMPSTIKAYVHRVGRTARAGRVGRSISLIGEDERKLLKAIYKNDRAESLKIRRIAPEVVKVYSERISSMQEAIIRIEKEEAAEKLLRATNNAIETVETRLRDGTDERAKRVWLQKQSEKAAFKKGKKSSGKNVSPKTGEERRMDNQVSFHLREAKRAKRLKRMRVVDDDNDQPTAKKQKKKHSFTAELTSVKRQSLKKFRYGPEDPQFKKAKRNMTQKGSLKGPRKSRR